jgi:hypothetical protein
MLESDRPHHDQSAMCMTSSIRLPLFSHYVLILARNNLVHLSKNIFSFNSITESVMFLTHLLMCYFLCGFVLYSIEPTEILLWSSGCNMYGWIPLLWRNTLPPYSGFTAT